jgi:hypothetical protein
VESLRRHHDVLEEKWRQEVERGEWQDDLETLEKVRAKWRQLTEGPSWDSVTLAIADAIRTGEPVCVLDHGEHFQSSMNGEKGEIIWQHSSPEAHLEWLRGLQQAFPIITLKLADEKQYQKGVEQAKQRQQAFQQLADRQANLAAPREDTQRLHLALDAYSDWTEKTYRTPHLRAVSSSPGLG